MTTNIGKASEPMTEKQDPPEPLPSQNIDSKATSMTLQPGKPKRRAWYRRLGAGIRQDIRARGPWYFSDWADAWNYRVVPATALIFFAKYVQHPRPW